MMSEQNEARERSPLDLTGMLISCDDCRMQGTDACDDCVVSYIVERPEGAVVFDAAEERALREMSRAGLLPGVLWQSRGDEETGTG
jgi:hypothetical protein